MAVLRIAPMSLADLEIAVEWAAAEGWNPGLDDAAVFHASDPDGFLMGWLGDQPVACISVVRHSAEFGFLGFYICHPDHRGQGHGWAVWQAGLAHLGTMTVGLDGVPAQEENYRRSGFEFAFRSQRFEGAVTGCSHPGIVSGAAAEELLALDQSTSGVTRPAYLRGWFSDSATRRTLVRRENGKITAAGTIRACRQGHKIGPLIAPDAECAVAMAESLVAAAGATHIAIDIPETAAHAEAVTRHFGLHNAFACARMYKGAAPAMDMQRIVGLTSFELGQPRNTFALGATRPTVSHGTVT